MNNLEDLLDRIKESMAQLWSRVEENSTYNTVRENFETLPSSTQKLLKAGGILLLLVGLFAIPISNILGASSYVSEFDQKRELVEDLIKASADQQKGSPLPPGLNSQALQSRVQSKVTSMRLMESQGPTITPLGDKAAGNLAPKAVTQTGVAVDFQGLNLSQVLDVGARLEALDASVKMMGMKVQPSQKFKNYYDATFQLVSFSLPVSPAPAAGDDKKNKKSSFRRGSERGSKKSRSSRRIKKRGGQ